VVIVVHNRQPGDVRSIVDDLAGLLSGRASWDEIR
jgi:hypothetical protein